MLQDAFVFYGNIFYNDFPRLSSRSCQIFLSQGESLLTEQVQIIIVEDISANVLKGLQVHDGRQKQNLRQ